MAKLLPALRQVRAANTEVEITETFPLSDLVTGDLTKLIRYSGGLTTPGCNEIVKVRSNFKMRWNGVNENISSGLWWRLPWRLPSLSWRSSGSC